ncbi:MAG: hypothetical protein GX621_16490 [Pirellulaceae bacterium]|nr:hypothetical protein [Pirellulaceae bacterium]
MISGVFTFPFYLTTLGPWLYISMGLLITAMLLMFWLGPGMVLGLSSARLIGLPTCAAALLTFSYAAACCLTIVEDTFNGWDVVEEWPDLEWKEWVWSFTCMVTLTLQALLVGLVAELAFGAAVPWLFPIGTLIAFPFIVLGSLGAEAWVPMAIGRCLLSLRRLWWAWALFYLETTPLIVGWFILSAVGLVRLLPFTVPFFSAPLLAFVVLVYARLLGRLARLIREKE